MQPQIEHGGPEIRDLLVANSFLSRHVRSGDQALTARILPMGLPPHSAHDPVRIKREIAHGKDSFFFSLRYSVTGEPCGPDSGVLRTRSRFGSAPQATTSSPAGTRLPLFVWMFRSTVLPSKPFKLSPISMVTPCFA